MKQKAYSLSEQAWERDFQGQRYLLYSDYEPYSLDLSRLQWMDLWPVVHLTKDIYLRRQRGKATTVKLPSLADPDKQEKIICFLVDIGFIGFAVHAGVEFFYKRQRLVLDLDDKFENHTLSLAAIERLKAIGYEPKEYRDRILLPLMPLSSANDVERMRQRLWAILDTPAMRHYKKALSDGSLIDTFFRELTENAIEHAREGLRLVTVRLLRSPFDLRKDRQDPARHLRAGGKLPPLKTLLQSQPDAAFIELHVADMGPGIQGTVVADPAATEPTEISVYQTALRPDFSSLPLNLRLDQGKSELTGLGACSYCLEDLPAVITFREKNSFVYAHSSNLTREPVGLPQIGAVRRPPPTRLRFHRVPVSDVDYTIGCNVQVVAALPDRIAGHSRVTSSRRAGVSDLAFQRLVPAANRDVSLLRDAQGTVIVDVSALPSDKDSARALLTRLGAPSAPRPLALVGASASLVWRLRHTVRLLQQQPTSLSQPPWPLLAMDASGEASIISDDPANDDTLLKGLFAGSLASHFGQHQISQFQSVLPFLQRDGSVARPLEELLWGWFSGLKQTIRARLEDTPGIIRKGCTVLLPNGLVVDGYVDVNAMLEQREFRSDLATMLLLLLDRLEVDAVVTYSSLGRRVLRETMPLLAQPCAHIDLWDPYSAALEPSHISILRGKRIALLGDIAHTRKHLQRIRRTCETHELNAVAGIVVVSSASGPSDPSTDLGMPFFSLINVPLNEVPSNAPEFTVDPYTLSLESATTPVQAGPSRDQASSLSTYNTLRSRKALVQGHFRNHAGRHFVLAVDFNQLLSRSFRRHLLPRLAEAAKGAKVILVPEHAAVSSIAEDLATELGLPASAVARAVPAPGTRYKHRFSVSSFERLREAADAGYECLFLDDAWSTQHLFHQVATSLTRTGFTKIKVCLLLDNRPTGLPRPSGLVADDGRKIAIRISALYRTFFPVYLSGSECPLCELATRLQKAIDQCNNAHLRELFSHHLATLTPIDPRGLTLTPDRCTPIDAVPLPQHVPELVVPSVVYTREELLLALLELAPFRSALPSILAMITPAHPMAAATAVLVASLNVPRLRRGNHVEDFLTRFLGVLEEADGSTAESLLLASLLWPPELAAQLRDPLLATRNVQILHTDRTLALTALVLQLAAASPTRPLSTKAGQATESATGTVRRVGPARRPRNEIVDAIDRAFAADGAGSIESAIRLLISRLMPHRQVHHRLDAELKQLSTIATAQVFEATFSSFTSPVTGSEPSTAAERLVKTSFFLALGEVAQALATLIERGVILSASAQDVLLLPLQRVLWARSELERRLMQPATRHAEFVTELFERIGPSLHQVSRLVPSDERDTSPHGELTRLMQSRVCSLREEFVLPLTAALNDEKIVSRGPLIDTLPHLGISVFSDKQLARAFVRSVANNVAKVFARVAPGPREAHLYADLTRPPTVSLTIANPCSDPTAVERFRFSEDSSVLRASAARHGGEYLGDYSSGQFFTTLRLLIV